MTEHGCKVCRVLDERDLDRYEDRLVEQWQADPPDRKGYRQLAEWLNVTMLRREMDRAGLSTLGEEAASKYERLQRDEESLAEEVASDLAAAGIAIDDLRDDFVSYGVVRTHLTGCLGLEHDREPGDWEGDAIDIAREHAETKIAEAVRSLDNKNDLAGGEVRVNVDVELECDSCHASVPVRRVLRRGYICQCE